VTQEDARVISLATGYGKFSSPEQLIKHVAAGIPESPEKALRRLKRLEAENKLHLRAEPARNIAEDPEWTGPAVAWYVEGPE
jgi:SpoVK/Ycf46/Vps4 family AAA+-type ATPase